jgi:hydrogenase maturation factor HypF (carbamoyltransferase family)
MKKIPRTYPCKKCGGRFRWIDPLDPQNGVLAEAARICPECREKLIKLNKKRAWERKKERQGIE